MSKGPFATLLRLLRSHWTTAALLYLVATLVFTYPTCFRIFSHAVGDGGDTWHYVWAQWWLGYVSSHPEEQLFQSKMLFHPDGFNLYTHNLLLSHCVLLWPIERLWGPVVAINLYFLFSFWYSAMGAYALLRYLTGKHRASLLGGFIFAFSPNMTAHGLGHLGLIDMGWMPLFLLFFLRTLRERGWWQPVVAAFFLIGQLYTDYTVSIFTLMLTTGWVLLQGREKWKEYWQSNAASRVVLMGVLVFAAFGPYFMAGRADPNVQDFLKSRSWNAAHQYGAPLLGFITPSPLHPLWGELTWKIYKQFWTPISDGTVYLGWTVMPLAALALWHRRKEPVVRIAAVLFVVFALISMGPTLRVLRGPVLNVIGIDDANITPGMPFTLLHFPAPLRQLRLPARFIIVVLLMLALMATHGFAWLQGYLAERKPHLNRQLVLGVWAALVVVDFLALPFESDTIQVPTVYRKLATVLPKEAAVLDLPWGCRDGLKGLGESLLKSMYYQSVHERPIVGGYITRLPQKLIDQYRPYPFLMETAEQLAVEPTRCEHGPGKDVEDELEKLKIGVVVIHKDRVPDPMEAFVHRHLTAGRWENEGSVEAYFPRWITAGKAAKR